MSEFHELDETELDALIARVSEAVEHNLALSVADMQLLLKALVMLVELQQRMSDRDITLHKLRKLAGIVQSSEKLKAVVPEAAKAPKRRQTRDNPAKSPAEPVIHQRCHHAIEGLEKGQVCPECERGRLYKYDPAMVLRISGQTPLTSVQHILERLRCNTCGAYFTAEVSEEVKADGGVGQKYTYSARALIGLHKHFAGLPFYRQQSLQQMFGVPISASTAFDQSEYLANDIDPVVQCLKRQAGSAVHYHLDDTRNRILNQTTVEKPDRKTGKSKTRSGIYTSGVIATLAEGHECVLFQTNIGHAGEWIDELLSTRRTDAPAPILMSDALSSNAPSLKLEFIATFCNSHARRQFVEVIEHFPDKVPWVLERYGVIWDNERHCKTQGFSPPQRLEYHQAHSLPIMEELREWGQGELDHDRVEANSGLGKAIGYFLRHYKELSGFCRYTGAQLDNNEMETMLKLVIRGRKNAMFYKTLAGAAIADTIMSLIATCQRAGINTFDYLVVLQRHAQAVKRQPEQWLPWNYTTAVEAEKVAAAEKKAA